MQHQTARELLLTQQQIQQLQARIDMNDKVLSSLINLVTQMAQLQATILQTHHNNIQQAKRQQRKRTSQRRSPRA
ncbi:hypothetical protein GCM10007377_12340 [Galliscardovia ingluviei]|uniref:Uncharacterized protein n=1 Tax=Galliscardovia ingluviei TaxID=1769422 RepID=A0A8J3EYY3_9BIFI|nr:hypothetical protein GCM10007377_12340 [Galliscardovia ingluviei]